MGFLFYCAQGESRTHWVTWTIDLQSIPAPYGTTCAFLFVLEEKCLETFYVLRITWGYFFKESFYVGNSCEIYMPSADRRHIIS